MRAPLRPGRVRPARRVRLGLPALAVLGLVLAGCSEPVPADPTPSVPAPSAPSAPPAAPSTPSTSAPGGVSADRSTAGSDGLTVRYLDGGRVKTVRVEDFPR